MARTGLLLDFDGVIVDSEPAHATAKRLVLQRAGIRVDPGLYDRWKGRTDADFFAHVVRDLAPGASFDDLHEAKRIAYREVFDAQVALVPGIEAFLETARSAFAGIAVATSATRDDFDLADARFRLRARVDAVVTASDTDRHKPDPEPYLVALARLGLPAEAAVALDDSPNGVMSAVAAGVRVVGLLGAYDRPALLAAGAHATAPDLDTLTGDIGRLRDA